MQNVDMQEFEYNPSKKDLTDAKIHHMLSEELCKPRRVSEVLKQNYGQIT
jgi:solute carrier family 9 (sodium/hydrogen exchanger), member 3